MHYRPNYIYKLPPHSGELLCPQAHHRCALSNIKTFLENLRHDGQFLYPSLSAKMLKGTHPKIQRQFYLPYRSANELTKRMYHHGF